MSPEDIEQMIQMQMARADEMQRRLRDVVVESASPDRAVSIRVGPTGVPLDLLISERALSMGGARLAATILDCVHKAGQTAGEQTRQVVTELFGDRVDLDVLLPQSPPAY